MKKIAFAASLITFSLLSGVAHANFNSELNGAVLKADELKVYSVGGSYYFDSVNTSKGPLAEASFLDLQNSIDVSFTRFDLDDQNLNSWGVNGTYVLQNTGLFLNAGIQHLNGYSENIYTLGGGYYLSRDWAVLVDTQFDDDMNYQGFSLASKKLFDLGNDNFVSLEGAYINPDSGDDSFAVSADYYLNRNLSVGLGYEWSDSFSDGVSTVRSQWFISEQFAVSAAVSYMDDNIGSTTLYNLGATLRF
ncbi:MAG: putative porin [Paraglaciecola sp.]|uniref:putative porin n=1 Tax=Paraglaciecola sp. TaxID=1920173 RepID=UPI00273D3ECD|nr:putative porin [Paraglaciecola sp.]MDP5031688.1 putative porin [Paraglaciecola sp.]MDP5041619.1 putative porin [Paraglaciecola sp.]MDP5131870.1 putative porin [Paraglaciecola sp.]